MKILPPLFFAVLGFCGGFQITCAVRAQDIQGASGVQASDVQPSSGVQGASLLAPPPPPAAPAGTPAPVNAQAVAPYSAAELNQLLGPVALYPDPLIGLILPASMVPTDIALGGRYLDQGGDPAQIGNQPWDDSVKGLMHYPDLVKWLNQNIAWTTQLGAAYSVQPIDVMNAIQQLRARAKADGTLVSTQQEEVGVDTNGAITITPTDGNTVYVPQYDPGAVYDDSYTADAGPVITYGAGNPTGPWLNYWPNWHEHQIYNGDWTRWKTFHGGGQGFAGDTTAHPWTPPAASAPTGERREPRNTNDGAGGNPPPRTGIETPHALPGVTVVQPRHTAGNAPGGQPAWQANGGEARRNEPNEPRPPGPSSPPRQTVGSGAPPPMVEQPHSAPPPPRQAAEPAAEPSHAAAPPPPPHAEPPPPAPEPAHAESGGAPASAPAPEEHPAGEGPGGGRR